MDAVQEQIYSGKEPMAHRVFESRIYQIFPEHHGHYEFARAIVEALHTEQQYEDVYELYRNEMNI